jgi:hypothetical protein
MDDKSAFADDDGVDEATFARFMSFSFRAA